MNNKIVYTQLDEMSSWTKFFVMSSGTTLPAFLKSAPDDQQKRRNAGIVVFTIAAVSAFIASISWAIPMGPIGFIVGPIWFCIMLFLERAILQQMDAVAAQKLAAKYLNGNFDPKEEQKSGVGAGWLLLRFTMIFFICYFNSEMVRVILFKPEIVAEIKIRQDAQTAAIADSLQKAKQSVNDRISEKEEIVKNAQHNLAVLIQDYDNHIESIDSALEYFTNKLVFEVKGPGGITGKTGDGPVAKTIRETVERLKEQKANILLERAKAGSESVQASTVSINQDELDAARKRASKEIALIDTTEARLVAQVLARPVNGLAFMLEVLNDIAGRNPIIWAVFFMFFFIEGIPVLLKFFSKNDSFVLERAQEHLDLIEQSNQRAAETYDRMEEIARRRQRP